MRIIYKKDTGVVVGTIAERVTSHIPASFIGTDTDYLDIDYDQDALDRKHPLATYLEANKHKITEKILTINPNKTVNFTDQPPKKGYRTQVVDLDTPVLDKDVKTYEKRAELMGARVEFDDIDSTIIANIFVGNRKIGFVRLIKLGCCTYRYEEGEALDRAFYPHYIAFAKIIEYLKGRAKYLDMGGFVKDEKDKDGINFFKKKFGRYVESMVID